MASACARGRACACAQCARLRPMHACAHCPTAAQEKGSKFTVEYSGFVDDDGEVMSESGMERKRLRLAPPAADKGWLPIVGEIVEV